MVTEFTGRSYVIVGGTSGIGYEIAARLSMCGAELFFVGRSESKIIDTVRKIGCGKSGYQVMDLETGDDGAYDQFRTYVRCLDKKYDGMVFSAGVADILPVPAMSYEKVKRVMSVNLNSFLCLIKALQDCWNRLGASIVAISSAAAVYPSRCQGIYAATKNALNVAVQSLAVELAEQHIRVNTVMPGIVDTPMLWGSVRKGAADLEMMTERLVGGGGISRPEDIADVVMFLLSNKSRAITGRAVFADGGYLNL